MWLVIAKGDFKGKSYRLEQGSNLVGRWDPDKTSFPEIDLEKEDPEAKVSRKHAMIMRSGDDITIEDLDSLNGTYLNRGPRLEAGEEYKLKPGDEIIIGKVVLQLEQNDSEES